MSTLLELQAELDRILPVDPSNLMGEASDNLKKHATYFHQLLGYKAKLRAANLELAELTKDRYNYYAGIGNKVFEYNLSATAIKYNLEGDHKVMGKQKEIMMIQLKLEFFEKACDMMVSRGFAIRNMIDVMKFQHGE